MALESGAKAEEASREPFEELLKHYQQRLHTTICDRADVALDKGELDHEIAEVESRLSWQQTLNQDLFRRVQMLEEVLQVERDKRCRIQQDLVGDAITPRRRSKDPPPSMEDLKESLLARKVFPSARMTLQLAQAEVRDFATRSHRDWGGRVGDDCLDSVG
mmetsp:Transcript_27594/g.48824  ORF Transcript_27594/g.48824 Transcript_27594/m.48824 type:complete len:161 (-) Transcript_27594:12-494(-)